MEEKGGRKKKEGKGGEKRGNERTSASVDEIYRFAYYRLIIGCTNNNGDLQSAWSVTAFTSH